MTPNTDCWKLNTPFRLEFGEGKPFQIMRTGKWNFKDYGEVDITTDDIRKFAANFKGNVRRQKLPINIEHMKELGKIGTIKDVEVTEDGTALYAIPDYTAKGEQIAKEEAFAYTSPELFLWYHDDEHNTDTQDVLSGVAFTNYPRFKGMQEIAASESAIPADAEKLSETSGDMAEHIADLVIAKLALERNLTTVTTDKDKGTPPVTPPTLGAETAAMFAEMQTQLSAAEAARQQLATELAAMKATLTTTTELLGAERQRRIVVECSDALVQAVRGGKITPAQQEIYMAELPKKSDEDRAFWLADIAGRPATAIRFGEIGSGHESDQDPEDDSHTALADRANKLFSEAAAGGKPITYRDALTSAAKEQKAKAGK